MSGVTLGFGRGGGASDWSRASGDSEPLEMAPKVDTLALGGGSLGGGSTSEAVVGVERGGRWFKEASLLGLGRGGGTSDELSKDELVLPKVGILGLGEGIEVDTTSTTGVGRGRRWSMDSGLVFGREGRGDRSTCS